MIPPPVGIARINNAGMLLTVLIACGPGNAEPPTCDGWGSASAMGVVEHADVTEASGLVASLQHEGVFWTHNDKGDSARLFAVGADGEDQGVLTVLGDAPTDWEDIATGPASDGTTWLYVGDIGDNDNERDSVRIWRVSEPTALGSNQTATSSSAFDLTYLDGPHDAEALLRDPKTGRLVIITKDKGTPGIYGVPDLDTLSGTGELTRLGSVLLPSDIDGSRKVSGADVALDGDSILLRTQSAVLVYTWSSNQDLAAALAGEACLAPAPNESNGEALAATDAGFATIGEAARPTLWQVSAP